VTGSLEFGPHLVDRQLDNGLRTVLLPDSSVPLLALNLTYHVGSKNERPGRSGLAHLFEHLLFTGSQHVGANDHFRLVQQVGGITNGSTSFDRTTYYETLPAHCLELGLWLESDRMGYFLPTLNGDKLETQRSIVVNERLQRVDNQPYGKAFETLHELLYPDDHPYHWPVIGYMADIEAATLADIEDFFRDYYTPKNAVLSLVGDFEPEETLSLIESYFGEIPSGISPARVEARHSALPGDIRKTAHESVPLPRVYFAFRGPAWGHPDRYAGELLSRLLGGGKSSPLYQDLVYRRQLAQDVAAAVLPLELASTVLVVATLKATASVREVEDLLAQHLENSMHQPGEPEDLERARNQIVTSYFNEIQSVERKAELLSHFTTFFGDPDRLDSEIQSYLDLEVADLVRFARTYLVPERRVVLTILPKEQES
jgi:zinc protease